MAITINLDVVLAKKKMTLKELSEKTQISETNLSNLKRGSVRAIRFSTLNAVCNSLDCKPGDIIDFIKDSPF